MTFKNLLIRVRKCHGKETCASESEIEEYIKNHKQLMIVYSTDVYQPNVYTDQVV